MQILHTEVMDINPVYGLESYSGQFSKPTCAQLGQPTTCTVAADATSYNLADFLFGLPSQVQLANWLVGNYRQRLYFLYAQDDFRVSSKLTLNLGLRWEYASPRWERDNVLSNFDPSTNKMITASDGGVYKRTRPRSNTGDWFSLIGNLQVAEAHDVAYDRNTHTLFAGVQDDDVTYQNTRGSLDWSPLLYGDGSDMNVDDTSTPGMSTRLSSVNRLRNFNRSFWDSDNNFLGVEFPALTVLDDGADLVKQFYTPVRMSGGDTSRIVIGGANSVYESFDQGDTIKEIGPGIRINSLGYEGLAYGVPGNPNALYVGGSDDPSSPVGNKLWVRTAAPPAPLARSLSYPGAFPIR